MQTRGQSPFLRPEAVWPRAGRLYSTAYMYGHFYRVLWKLLVQAHTDTDGPGTTDQEAAVAKTTAGKTQKAGYAVMFAGCEAGDGASTMAFNFASAFAAHSSKSVILVDGDLKGPVLHRQFDVTAKKGLSDLLTGETDVEDAVTGVIGQRYHFLQAGRRTANPIALYESSRFSSLMDTLRERYDLLIFDSPPLVQSPEALLLARSMNGVIMVLRAEKTRWKVAQSARDDLASIRVPLLGAVLNKKPFVIPDAFSRLL